MNVFKSSSEDVLAPRELINISDVISQTQILLSRIEDALSTDREYVMHLFEARSVHMDEIFDNHAGELGRPTCNIEKEELIDFLMSNIAGQRLYQHLVFQKEH